jgi:hypothetical protein
MYSTEVALVLFGRADSGKGGTADPLSEYNQKI